jgi:hypothetical protein
MVSTWFIFLIKHDGVSEGNVKSTPTKKQRVCKRGRKPVPGPHIFLNARWMLLISFPTSNNRKNENYLDDD